MDTITDSNSLRIHKEHNPPCVVKVYRGKPFTAKMVKYRALQTFGAQVPIEYRPAADRNAFECECLTLWREKGFRAPELLPFPDDLRGAYADGSTESRICLEYVEGSTFKEMLEDESIEITAKLAAVQGVLKEMGERHALALFEDDRRLVHYDSNMRNILMTADGPCHVDFEMAHFDEDVYRSAGREVKKFCLEVVNLLGEQAFEKILTMLIADYGVTNVLKRMTVHDLKRKFLSYHQAQDRKKKERQPGLITKIDLAEGLDARLDVVC